MPKTFFVICDNNINMKMVYELSFCMGCSSTNQGYAVRHSLPKKLLVATSVLVIIAMVVMPSEARTLDHRIRHERRQQDALALTKETRMKAPQVEHRRRQHRKPTLVLTQTTKDSPGTMRQQKNPADRFKNASRKIIKKLKNTRRFFNEERRVLNETREYRDGMPSWLPTINFVDIHFYTYRKRGATISERKFSYLMPKLYKSLVEYQEIFKLLLNIEVEFADDPFCSYNKTRHELIGKTLQRLYSTVAEIKENMIAVNVPVPQINKSRNLQALEQKVDAPQCLKNDYIAFRAYGNLLNNWYSEFRCPRGKKVITSNMRCASYEAKLKEKKDKRYKNTER